MAIWYHGTSAKEAKQIVNQGFKSGNTACKFGKGVYFTNRYAQADEIASCKTDDVAVIRVSVPAKVIKKYTYEELVNLFPHEPYEDFIPQVRNYILKLGYKGLQVEFEPKCYELVVYDTSCIKIEKVTVD